MSCLHDNQPEVAFSAVTHSTGAPQYGALVTDMGAMANIESKECSSMPASLARQSADRIDILVALAPYARPMPAHTASAALLEADRASQREALDRLLPQLYAELKRVARNKMRGETPGHTLQTTALVHEAYLRMVDQHSTHWFERGHFFALAAETMRRVLVNQALAARADKRGGDWQRVTLSVLDTLAQPEALATTDAMQVLDLDRALTELAALDPQQARVVELRYFAGLTIDETAAAMDLSAATVKREWATGRLWLRHKLQADPRSD